MKTSSVERLAKKLETHFGAPGFAWVGSSLIAAGETVRGIEVLKTHLGVSPGDFLGQLAMGRAEMLEGNYNEALACFREALQIDRSSPGAWNGVLEAAKFIGNDAVAQEAREMLSFLDPFYFRPVAAEAEFEPVTPEELDLLPSDEVAAAISAAESSEEIAATEDLDDFVMTDIFGNMESIGDLDVPVTQVAALLDQQEAMTSSEPSLSSDSTPSEELEMFSSEEEKEGYDPPVTGADVSVAIDALFGDDPDSMNAAPFLNSISEEETGAPLALDAEVSAELEKLFEDEDPFNIPFAEEQEKDGVIEISADTADLLGDLDSLLTETEQVSEETAEASLEVEPSAEADLPFSDEEKMSGLDSVFEVDESPDIIEAPSPESAAVPSPQEVLASSDPLAAAVVDELDSLFGGEELSDSSTSSLPEEEEPLSDPEETAEAVPPEEPFADLEETTEVLSDTESTVDPETAVESSSAMSDLHSLLSDLDAISDADLDGPVLFLHTIDSEHALSSQTQSSSSSTETMAQIYAAQGHYDDALKIYREMLVENEDLPEINEKIEELERLKREEAGEL